MCVYQLWFSQGPPGLDPRTGNNANLLVFFIWNTTCAVTFLREPLDVLLLPLKIPTNTSSCWRSTGILCFSILSKKTIGLPKQYTDMLPIRLSCISNNSLIAFVLLIFEGFEGIHNRRATQLRCRAYSAANGVEGNL